MKSLFFAIAIGCFSFLTANSQVANLDYIESTVSPKNSYDDPAGSYVVLDNRYGNLTENEINGLTSFFLNYKLPTHNYKNYYFRNRIYSYMAEWLYEKQTNNEAILQKAIDVAKRCVEYRNDNICSVNNKFKCYAIDFSRTVAPVWPNYKKKIKVHNGVESLTPGAGALAGIPVLSVSVRMIANSPELWNRRYKGKTYRQIASELIDEALYTVNYIYKTMVGNDNLIKYTNLVNTKDWPGYVFIYNRVLPVTSRTIPLIEALEIFNEKPNKVAKIDRVNNAMIDFLIDDMTFYKKNGKEVMYFPYSDVAQNVKGKPSEDFIHGSFDSRDFQLIYQSERYNFGDRHMRAMANTLTEVTHTGYGKFTGDLDGNGDTAKTSDIAFDGYFWYARYEPEVKKIIIDYILDNNIAKEGSIYDAVTIYEILKLKDKSVSVQPNNLVKTDKKINIYPNPTNESVNIYLNDFGTSNIEIIDLHGKIIQTFKNANKPSLNITLENYTKGIYFVNINNGTTIRSRKLVVQ